MAVVGTIEYIAKINTKDYESGAKKITDSNKDLEKGTEDASKKMQLSWRDSDKAFGSLVKGVIAGAAVAGAAVGAIAVSAIKSYASLEQSMGGAEAVFGEFGTTVQETARKSAAVMGTSANQYLETANKMGSLFQGAGFSVKESMELSGSAMQRATDVATAMGISTESALESIAGAAKGNFTMMDNLGVAMNDTTLQAYATSKGIAKTTQEMTNQEKVGLAMQLFMEKTSKYAGNYAKENETLSGSMSTLSASWGNFLAGVEGSDKQLASAIGNVINVFGQQIPEILGRMTGLVSEMVSSFLAANPQVATALEVFKQIAVVVGIFLIPQLIRYIALQTMAGVQALIAGARIAAGWLMALGPIGIIIAAVAAAAALIIMNWDWIKNAAISVWEWIVKVWSGITDFFGKIFEGVATVIKWYIGLYIGFFRGAWEGIKAIFGAVGGFFRGVWDTIAGIFGTIGSAIGNAIGNAFKFVVNSVINFAENTINGFIRAINGAIGLINKIPGVNINTLNELRIPRLAEGGIVPAQPGGILANIGEGREAEAVIPLSKLEAMIAGGGDTSGAPVTVNLSHSRGTMRQAAMDTIDLVNEVYRSRGMPEIGVTG